jgi:hypothetical protein
MSSPNSASLSTWCAAPSQRWIAIRRAQRSRCAAQPVSPASRPIGSPDHRRRHTSRQCKAMQGNARQCKAMQGNARQCKAMQGNARQGKARQGKARQGKARQGNARQGKARRCKARQCKAMQGNARQCKAMRQLTAKALADDHTRRAWAAWVAGAAEWPGDRRAPPATATARG